MLNGLDNKIAKIPTNNAMLLEKAGRSKYVIVEIKIEKLAKMNEYNIIHV